jgi:hypothetical protein
MEVLHTERDFERLSGTWFKHEHLRKTSGHAPTICRELTPEPVNAEAINSISDERERILRELSEPRDIFRPM